MDINEERADRLRRAMDGRTQAWLAEKIGVATSSINGYLTRGTVPQADVCLRMCDALSIDIRWYLSGETDERPSGVDGVVQIAFIDMPEHAIAFPQTHAAYFNVPFESLCCVMVGGTLMAPGIPKGSEVIGTRSFRDVEDGRVYIVRIGTVHTVRRIRVRGDGTLVGVCDNAAAVSEVVDEFGREDIVALGLWCGYLL